MNAPIEMQWTVAVRCAICFALVARALWILCACLDMHIWFMFAVHGPPVVTPHLMQAFWHQQKFNVWIDMGFSIISSFHPTIKLQIEKHRSNVVKKNRSHGIPLLILVDCGRGQGYDGNGTIPPMDLKPDKRMAILEDGLHEITFPLSTPPILNCVFPRHHPQIPRNFLSQSWKP